MWSRGITAVRGDAMMKTLKKRGNSYALMIDKALMQQLNVGPETRLQVVVSNGSLIVTPERVGLGQIGSELFGRERRRTHRQCVSRFSRP